MALWKICGRAGSGKTTWPVSYTHLFAGELGFEIAPDLMQAAQRFAPQIHAISAPRIWAECSKIVLADVKYQTPGGHARAMQALEAGSYTHLTVSEEVIDEIFATFCVGK